MITQPLFTKESTRSAESASPEVTVTRPVRWPVHAILVLTGLFVLIVLGMWIVSHLWHGRPVTQTDWIILAACLLRVITMVIALASIRPWGKRIAPWVVLGGLWGSASAQLIYPVAELAVKLVLLTGLIDHSSKGLGDMSPTGWFNLCAVWVIFGIPGLLFVLAAGSYKNANALSRTWSWIGASMGIVFLFLIGFLIG